MSIFISWTTSMTRAHLPEISPVSLSEKVDSWQGTETLRRNVCFCPRDHPILYVRVHLAQGNTVMQLHYSCNLVVTYLQATKRGPTAHETSVHPTMIVRMAAQEIISGVEEAVGKTSRPLDLILLASSARASTRFRPFHPLFASRLLVSPTERTLVASHLIWRLRAGVTSEYT